MIRIYILLLFVIDLNAFSTIDISKVESISVLERSSIYFDNQGLSLQKILENRLFKPYSKKHLNAGVSQSTVWVQFQLQNSSDKPIDKALALSSPLLELIELYQGENSKPVIKGVSIKQSDHTTISYYYNISLKPNTKQTYYLKVVSLYTPLDFSLILEDKGSFLEEDRYKQFINILLIGMLLALMLYALVLAFYTYDKGYLFYSLYILMIIYHQLTYVGLTQIYFPYPFIFWDMKFAILKLGALIISSALFVTYFLRLKSIPWLYRLYQYFIFFVVVEVIVLNLLEFYNLYIMILTGALCILFNFVAGLIAYKNGYKEARFFIVGFGVVFISYSMMIIDALGIFSIIQYIPNILMWSTVIEALFLFLAFTDRYKILQSQKEEADKNREQIIKNEVIEKTSQLNKALKTKELLLREVHHRVKNNLQIILSIIRLQSDKITDEVILEKFVNLENRINAIAKTYNMLLFDDDIADIDMEEYIESLLLDIGDSICMDCDIELNIDVKATLPLRKAVYLGIIINELITNSYKYAFINNKGSIYISLHQKSGEYVLLIRDSGRGFEYNKESDSLGLKLIQNLVVEQLQGDIEMITDNMTQYTIRFRL